MIFGKCIDAEWTAQTYAVSEKKARSNFIFQYKKQTNRAVHTKVELPGQIILEKEQ